MHLGQAKLCVALVLVVVVLFVVVQSVASADRCPRALGAVRDLLVLETGPHSAVLAWKPPPSPTPTGRRDPGSPEQCVSAYQLRYWLAGAPNPNLTQVVPEPRGPGDRTAQVSNLHACASYHVEVCALGLRGIPGRPALAVVRTRTKAPWAPRKLSAISSGSDLDISWLPPRVNAFCVMSYVVTVRANDNDWNQGVAEDSRSEQLKHVYKACEELDRQRAYVTSFCSALADGDTEDTKADAALNVRDGDGMGECEMSVPERTNSSDTLTMWSATYWDTDSGGSDCLQVWVPPAATPLPASPMDKTSIILHKLPCCEPYYVSVQSALAGTSGGGTAQVIAEIRTTSEPHTMPTTVSVGEGHVVSVSEGQTKLLSEGNTMPQDNMEYTTAVTEGLTVPVNEGTTALVREVEEVSVLGNDGFTVSVNDGHTVESSVELTSDVAASVAEGHTVSEIYEDPDTVNTTVSLSEEPTVFLTEEEAHTLPGTEGRSFSVVGIHLYTEQTPLVTEGVLESSTSHQDTETTTENPGVESGDKIEHHNHHTTSRGKTEVVTIDKTDYTVDSVTTDSSEPAPNTETPVPVTTEVTECDAKNSSTLPSTVTDWHDVTRSTEAGDVQGVSNPTSAPTVLLSPATEPNQVEAEPSYVFVSTFAPPDTLFTAVQSEEDDGTADLTGDMLPDLRVWCGALAGTAFVTCLAATLLLRGAIGAKFDRFRCRSRGTPLLGLPQPVAVKRFSEHCEALLGDDDVVHAGDDTPGTELRAEFELLATLSAEYAANQNCSVGRMPENRYKNRYANVLPYDMNRVPLCDEDDPWSDYINASFIKGFSGSVEYIATQGPKEETAADFWNMVWQQGVRLVVMLTGLVEKDKVKCHAYYPAVNEHVMWRDLVVGCSVQQDLATYTLRTIVMQKGSSPDSAPDRRLVQHLHLRDWPDFGCPSSTGLVLNFCRTLRRLAAIFAGPIAVHCSAGVGRTGTLIAVDVLLQTARAGRPLDVFGVVLSLREQRALMVQTETQYTFIYRCIKDAVEDPAFLKSGFRSSQAVRTSRC